MGLLLVYIVIITGWIGYTKSIAKRPHEGGKGNARFVIEVIITFFLSYLINLTNPEEDVFTRHFGDAFLWVLPVVFGLFVPWDVLKYLEYKDNPDEDKKANSTRVLITIFAFVAIFVQLLTYIYFRPRLDTDPLYLYYIISSIIIVVIYRLVKWEDKPRSVREL